MNEPQYMYYVEYFCPNEFKESFKKAKEREMQKFGEILTEQNFAECDGYIDSFICSDNFDSENKAIKFAKQISKKNKDLARVFAGWCCYNEFGRLDFDEFDEKYLREFNVGREI